MAFLKSLFISLYSVALFVVAAYSIARLRADPIVWGAVLLTVLPMLVLISRLLLFKNVVRTRRHLPLVFGSAILGAAVATFTYWLRSDFGVAGESALAAALSLAALAGFLLYDFWYSSFGARQSRIEVGQLLPDFELVALNGKTIASQAFRGSPAILIFHRGNWCPLCVAQIKEVASNYSKIAESGAKIVLISPQPQSHTQRLASKFDVPFVFMTDDSNSAARKLGIANRFGTPFGFQLLGYKSETVLPTVIIIDAGGTIIFADQTDSYRIRPEPARFLRILRDVAGS